MKTRAEKINFLNELLTGQRNLNELNREHNKLWQFIHEEDKPGEYVHFGTNEIFSKEQINEIKKKGGKVLIVEICSTPDR